MPAGRRSQPCTGSNEGFQDLIADPKGHQLMVTALEDDSLLVICSRCGGCGTACLRSLKSECSGLLNRGAAERVRAVSRGVHPAPRSRALKVGQLVPLGFAIAGLADAGDNIEDD
jgi:hypothetical protein